MLSPTPNCFRNGKKGRDPLCNAGTVVSLASLVNDQPHWGKITSRRHPPPEVFRNVAKQLNTTVEAVRKLWEKGLL